MRMKLYLLIILCLTLATVNGDSSESSSSSSESNEAQETCSAAALEARLFFERETELQRQRKHRQNLAEYNYNINVTDANRLAMIELATAAALESKKLASRIRKLDYLELKDPLIQRQAKLLAEVFWDSLDEADYKKKKNATSSMQSNYVIAKVCSYTNASDCSLTLEPHIQERLSNSRDAKELAHYWREWHNKAGTPMRENFKQYVQLSEKAAHLNSRSSFSW